MTLSTLLFNITDGALEFERERVVSEKNLGANGGDWPGTRYYRLKIGPPYFWKKRHCRHPEPKNGRAIRDGRSYCLWCNQSIVQSGGTWRAA